MVVKVRAIERNLVSTVLFSIISCSPTHFFFSPDLMQRPRRSCGPPIRMSKVFDWGSSDEEDDKIPDGHDPFSDDEFESSSEEEYSILSFDDMVDVNTIPPPSIDAPSASSNKSFLKQGWNPVNEAPKLKERYSKCKTHGKSMLPGLQTITEMMTFFQFLSEDFWHKVVGFSNSRDDTYKMTYSKLLRYLSVCIYKSILGLNSVNEIWNSEDPLVSRYLREVISFRDFWGISRILRVSEFEEGQRVDNLCKIRYMVTVLNESCQRNYSPGQYVSIDECSPGYGGRCQYTKRTKHKKVPSALQSNVMCDARSAYFYAFEFRFDNIVKNSPTKGVSETASSVIRLRKTLKDNWHCFVMDNLFNSPKLALRLLSKKCTCFGTWRSRYGMPDFMKLQKLQGKALKQATNRNPIFAAFLEDTPSGSCTTIPSIAGMSLYDNGAVSFLTTHKIDLSKSFIGGDKKVLRLLLQHEYNGLMNGVDTLGQLVEYFSTYYRSKKWWKRLFHWMLDVALVDAYICFKEPGNSIDRRKFLRNVAKQLLNYAIQLEKREEEEVEIVHQTHSPSINKWRLTVTNQRPDIRLTGDHVNMKMQKSEKCTLCRLRHTINYTSTFCDQCQKYLCPLNCWTEFHTKETLQ